MILRTHPRHNPNQEAKAKPDTRTAAQKKKDQDWAKFMLGMVVKANYEAGRGLGT